MPNDMQAPTLKEVIKEKIDFFQEDLSVMIPCTIVSFDPKKQTATVRPVSYDMDKDGVTRKQADINSVPVVFPSSGNASLTFPVKKGHECIVVFSQRGFDTWWVTGRVPSQPSTQRLHDYNDAIAIVGLKSKNNSLNASTENVELRFEDDSGGVLTKITMTPDGKFRIENNQEELINILSELINTLANNTINTIYGTSPMNSKTQLESLKQRLDTLKD